ncbi:membrane protein [Beggiatoa sp. PS]|nr:membrane protein [Beggiatoa sp. PS]
MLGIINFLKKKRLIFFVWRMIFLGMLVVPLFYGLANIPLEARYYNLFIFLVILVIGLEFNRFLSMYSNQIVTSTYVFIFIMALTIELLPFRPIFGFFIPIWNQPNWSHHTAQYNNPIAGRNYIGWWAVGEEIFFVGKQIEKMVAKNQISQQHDIRIYGGPDWFLTGSYALWLTPPEFIKNCPPKKLD